jgi:L-lactate dehydrogenase complex protein LldG
MVADARAEVLRRVRAAIGASGDADAEAVGAEWDGLARGYKRTASLVREEILELLEDRLWDYDATVVRVAAGEVTSTIARMLGERGKRRLVVPEGLEQWLGQLGSNPTITFANGPSDHGAPKFGLPEGFEFVVDEGFGAAELDGFEGVVTASTVAIAETGTIVLQNVAGQGRRAATLVPDYHLCIVRASDVVETVPEAMGRLQATAALATTFISGP